MGRIPVVLDVNVLVNAIATGDGDVYSWPTVPRGSGNPAADSVGVVNDDADFALWLSPHILRNTRRVLLEAGFTAQHADDYLEVLEEIAHESGGDVVDPPRTVLDCPDHEDNLILDLARYAGAPLIVSDDTDLTAMSPWKGTPILRPKEFASRADVMHRARPRPTRSIASDLRARRAAPAEPEPITYAEGRETFGEDLEQLRSTVASWTPTTVQRSAQITRWEQKVAKFDLLIERIDALAQTSTDYADAPFAKIRESMDHSLEEIAPQAPKRATRPRQRTTLHVHEEAQNLTYEP